MKKITFTILSVMIISCACKGQEMEISFNASDTALESAFNRAKQMALHYSRYAGDPVGPWYESALPPRDAFCMRDVSHQCTGAEILGLSGENKNMFTLFVKNISESKDWCTYWEINKYGNPAPEDYRNDKEFWYDLDANFDVLNACWRLYLWTGDTTYISSKLFFNFFQKTAGAYIERWVLDTDSLLTRPGHPNVPVPYHEEDAFQRCRGLPSYGEVVPNLKMGVDLVAALYGGLLSYSDILKWNGDSSEAAKYAEKAKLYQDHIDQYWWDDASSLYNTYYTNDNKFGQSEGESFLLWFDALKDNGRKQKTIMHLNAVKWNIETLSYLPLMMYRNGYPDKAYEYILHLSDPSTKRREYPEVSFGVIEGIVQGLMGIDADARFNRISTIYRGKSVSTAQIRNLPVLGIRATIRHKGNKNSEFYNGGKKIIVWRPEFMGNFSSIRVDGKSIKAAHEKDAQQKIISFTDIIIPPGKKTEATAGSSP